MKVIYKASIVLLYTISIIFIVSLAKYPFSEFIKEFIFWCMCFTLMVIQIFWTLYLANCIYKKTRPLKQLIVIPFNILLMVGILIFGFLRIYGYLLISAECEGTVVEKFRSTNNATPSIRFKDSNNNENVFEGVYPPTWEKIQIGDHILKKEFNPYALVNGNERIFVEPYLWSGTKGCRLPSSAKKQSTINKENSDDGVPPPQI